ncbi:tRNA-uridine aminocarboxypropyltransferase [Marchantia polymorpha subsp. ruderalis]|uniref:tRNA-uridine aminocarboxypropyltransferase n=2 Tax=Marchantia polymorpha TaxID=3197 RepID=A0AAF6BIB4_MARPO|nr:hypothetical protein MARPO_0032s0131 [Marchantia polymorpha]BBN11748.1 hypothetical protein Mp_5g14380 [Marchantia polymorpha subsp. ruderalis]|eukprot:PTQ41966.1 hypothetical protein MARPO_0032s0131 [Marchantia polymorpha]
MSSVSESILGAGFGAVRHSARALHSPPALACPAELQPRPRSSSRRPKTFRGAEVEPKLGGAECGDRWKLAIRSSGECASNSSRVACGLKMCPTAPDAGGVCIHAAASRVTANSLARIVGEGNSGVNSEAEEKRTNAVDCSFEEISELDVSRGRNVEDSRAEAADPTFSDEEGLAMGSLQGFGLDDVNSPRGSDEECSSGGEGNHNSSSPRKRGYCKRCCKAASRCICDMITSPVNNKTGIIILQHPLENNHHLGTARIAVVGLRNVELISVPEDEEQFSTRLRPKVPGSKRQIAGRGGKKAQFLSQGDPHRRIPRKPPGEPKRQTEATIQVKHEVARQSERATDDNQVVKMATLGTKFLEQDVSSIAVPSWINLQPDAGLLFPSEHAIDLSPIPPECNSVGSHDPESDTILSAPRRRSPSQLIVLDGTWSKAKRIFYENPWLYSLPHYRLPPCDGGSRYGLIRKEPKPGCMSTVESIVLALQTLEPEIEGLDSLLNVFDFMIEDQKRCMGDKYAALEEKCRNGITQRSKASK